MEVSAVCRQFIACANVRDWRNALLNLNGLSMYEMLRALKALDAADIMGLRTALTAVGGAVGGPRIEYAVAVVVNKALPATAPRELAASGQVTDAQRFHAKPRSILVELIPKARITGYNAGLSPASNATTQTRLGAPRSTYTQSCQAVTNTSLARRIVTRNVGPFSVTALDSAVASLTTIMPSIAASQRLVHRVLGTAAVVATFFPTPASHASSPSAGSPSASSRNNSAVDSAIMTDPTRTEPAPPRPRSAARPRSGTAPQYRLRRSQRDRSQFLPATWRRSVAFVPLASSGARRPLCAWVGALDVTTPLSFLAALTLKAWRVGATTPARPGRRAPPAPIAIRRWSPTSYP